MSSLLRFKEDEDGAISVDMVGIMGAVLMLGTSATGVVSMGVENTSTDLSTYPGLFIEI